MLLMCEKKKKEPHAEAHTQ